MVRGMLGQGDRPVEDRHTELRELAYNDEQGDIQEIYCRDLIEGRLDTRSEKERLAELQFLALNILSNSFLK